MLCVWMCLEDTHEVCHVATNLPANQMSVFVGDVVGSRYASYAVDGRRDTTWNGDSCCVTNSETNPWWSVDLGIPLTVTSIHFTNIGDAQGMVGYLQVRDLNLSQIWQDLPWTFRFVTSMRFVLFY